MRISSSVFRSGARSEAMDAIHAFCACSTAGAHSVRNVSDGNGQTSASTSMSSDSSGSVRSSPGLMAARSYRWRAGVTAAGGRGGSLSRLGVPRLAEEPLRDHVALHLARAAGNGEAAGGQETLLPALRPAVEHGGVGTVQGHAHLLDPLFVLDSAELAHAGTAARIDARERAQRRAVAEQGHRLRLGDQATEPLLEAGGERIAALGTARHGADE